MSTRTSQQSPESAISDEIGRIYEARYGRGPTKTTTHILREAVVCLLRNVNTPAQEALVQMGKVDVAQAVHGELQMGMADEMQAAVERITGRRVSAYVPVQRCGERDHRRVLPRTRGDVDTRNLTPSGSEGAGVGRRPVKTPPTTRRCLPKDQARTRTPAGKRMRRAPRHQNISSRLGSHETDPRSRSFLR